MRDNIPLKMTLDREIMWTVKELNKKGYSTKYSCAGHNKDKYGYIMFNKNVKKKNQYDVEQILRKHGLRGVKFPKYRRELVGFNSVGK